MLAEWLRPMTPATFRAEHLGRTPLARPGTSGTSASRLDWAVLDRVLASGRARVLVIAAGREVARPVPRSAPALRTLLREGVGVCIQHAERGDGALADVAAAFERDLGATQVQIFVTPGRNYGFGWHFDDEDVFIAQTQGVKDYYFRPNTVCVGRADPAEFARFPSETSAVHTARLIAGDFLYLPARWWHTAVCREEAHSLSVGVLPRGG
jgi:hypothetical protein